MKDWTDEKIINYARAAAGDNDVRFELIACELRDRRKQHQRDYERLTAFRSEGFKRLSPSFIESYETSIEWMEEDEKDEARVMIYERDRAMAEKPNDPAPTDIIYVSDFNTLNGKPIKAIVLSQPFEISNEVETMEDGTIAALSYVSKDRDIFNDAIDRFNWLVKNATGNWSCTEVTTEDMNGYLKTHWIAMLESETDRIRFQLAFS